ncbi:MAG: DUF4258 domain-containing protein [Candidatus Thorarchaeota archaeon]|nr:MAG: hypothetical protein DRP09_17175 [Candidatus Thorarchaeota archaeon]RLI54507.1 MAG: hypothetical protein DRO87_10075 [Candidatus Thorarchaeota archaeon]
MIVFTKHALERMKQRSITRGEVVQALTTSEEVVRDSLGHSIAQVGTDGQVLRVFFVERDRNIIVITAYKTSKEKYRRM